MPLARDLAARAATIDPHDPGASPLAWLRPIDSEHSAIWQCLVGERMDTIATLILTASGGPFLESTGDEIANAGPEQALRHPTWSMGAKITVDSATLVNKGLEVIEAHWLYDVGYDAIEVVIHPQSVVHSAVRFVDGSLKAQLGNPDMRLPIQYALTYPDRRASPVAAPDLVEIARLDFRAPDETRFPALRICSRRRSHRTVGIGSADRRRRGRGRPVPGRHARFPGHRPSPGGRRWPVRIESRRAGPRRPRAARRRPFGRPSRAARSGQRRDRIRPVAHHRHPVRADPGRAGPHPRAGPFRHGPAGPGARARVRRRLPAPGQGAAPPRRDALHAQLAADRRVRQARGRGRQRGRGSTLIRLTATANQAAHPRRRRGHERRPGVRHLHRDRTGRRSHDRLPDRNGPGGLPGGLGRSPVGRPRGQHRWSLPRGLRGDLPAGRPPRRCGQDRAPGRRAPGRIALRRERHAPLGSRRSTRITGRWASSGRRPRPPAGPSTTRSAMPSGLASSARPVRSG